MEKVIYLLYYHEFYSSSAPRVRFFSSSYGHIGGLKGFTVWEYTSNPWQMGVLEKTIANHKRGLTG